ncbi:hypothetical protein F2P81_000346 [Scophthalmus maximus]|uniref:Rho-GAP domain-containing protein n=1 Tax=Scophthalmus maximus TaxID=52904 RepID=A0A6A4TKX5_SCOMX|nr:hypothetical protein F2P81_000346 [Scophthalmus maximus]
MAISVLRRAVDNALVSRLSSAAMKSSSSVDASDNKKTRHKLKKFLTRRPTLQAVRDKGYIEDQVFGCSLSSLCHREGSSVPGFVTTCIDHVENSGLCVDGLYRVSGNLAVIQKLRFAINHDEKVNLSDGKWEDIHVTTGALKMYFRELPEPLFTYTLFHDFVGAIKISDYKQKVQSIKELVRQLPRPNHDTMQVLFKHLRKVIDHGEENRMTTQSVAIVFGPTLLRPETETWNMAVHMVYQNQIVELILLEYENFFGRENDRQLTIKIIEESFKAPNNLVVGVWLSEDFASCRWWTKLCTRFVPDPSRTMKGSKTRRCDGVTCEIMTRTTRCDGSPVRSRSADIVGSTNFQVKMETTLEFNVIIK